MNYKFLLSIILIISLVGISAGLDAHSLLFPSENNNAQNKVPIVEEKMSIKDSLNLETQTDLSKNIIVSSNFKVNFTSDDITFVDSKSKISVETATIIDNKKFTRSKMSTKLDEFTITSGEKTFFNLLDSPTISMNYKINATTIKETIVIKEDKQIKFALNLNEGSTLREWDEGNWIITTNDDIYGVLILKPYGIDANNRIVDMKYTWDGTYLSLVYNRTAKSFNPTLTKSMNEQQINTAYNPNNPSDTQYIPKPQYDYVPITYPLTIDPTYSGQYPLAYSTTYVQATTAYAGYPAYYTMNPALSLTGTQSPNQWISTAGTLTNQRFHIDLGSVKIINRVNYHNSHHSGTLNTVGVSNFTMWGSNSASSFANLTYTNDTGWTRIPTPISDFKIHKAVDASDPQNFTIDYLVPYRYYAFKFAKNWGSTSYMGVRRIELQVENVSADIYPNTTAGYNPLTVEFTNKKSYGYSLLFGDDPFNQAWRNSVVAAPWTARYEQPIITSPNGNITMLGGSTVAAAYLNDVWASADNGTTWSQMTAAAGWAARTAKSQVALNDNTLVVMGGYIVGGYKNDVWSSTNGGTSWTQINTSAGWTARYGHASVVTPNNTIILMGGYDSGAAYKNDVWVSNNKGVNWQLKNSSAGWAGRIYPAAVSLSDNTIILVGGGSASNRYNDTWRSIDNGSTWVRVNTSPGWQPRYTHALFAMPDDSIILTNGYNDTSSPKYLNDVWRSKDKGSTWTQLSNCGMSGRLSPAYTVLPDGSMLIGGGQDSTLGNTRDLWQMQPATLGSYTTNPTHTYSNLGTYNVSVRAYYGDGYKLNNKFITSIQSNLINVFQRIFTTFTSNVTTTTVRSPIQFTNTSTTTATGWSWFFGDELYNQSWTLINSNSGWEKRWQHAMTVMPDGRIILTGGLNGAIYYNDTWMSINNGTTWTLRNSSSGWSKRYAHNLISTIDNTLILTNGYDGTNYYNDTWISTDYGSTWTSYIAPDNGGSYQKIMGQSQVVLPSGFILTTGGYTGVSRSASTWISSNKGKTWTDISSTGWSARLYHTMSVLKDGSILLMGGDDGSNKNDVWRSTTDGRSWVLVNASADWAVRKQLNSVAMPDNSVLVIGGIGVGTKDDVWRSTNNGSTWTAVNSSVNFNSDVGMYGGSAVLLQNGSVLVTSGYGSGTWNGTYFFNPVSDITPNPIHKYTTQGVYNVSLLSYNQYASNATQKPNYITITDIIPLSIFTKTYPLTSINATLLRIPQMIWVNGSSGNSGVPTSWTWNWGDGQPNDNSQNATHKYIKRGAFNITLTVSNGGGSNINGSIVRVTGY